ncbi:MULTISPECIES: IS256 family transposase [unclassified Planococcus (in: firmicutes)]|uniref:IS256 family transposase n=1 Tax=unclassified Planococcus (in: firmicutes) TaxID=2662419 RepID=UPI000C34CCC7|nr:MULTISPECIES: IS256 family transposase [unclassified Planococcus (in: firmicutes)]AUD13479.1 IS256 family transposase [Planococcus sp. MB-3u-03]PKG46100.1 IS256 family transposase [Planococcus sp. Urea-trap-24]PKG89911.1 IS256 family transposase [Planococcus sp. Urea-3u-39]PKH43997.1 IS256 family transposase [Planococcus sp. MB-3u-09]
MTQFTTDLMQALVKKEDIPEVFRKHLETAVNTLLQTELTAFLDYEKYDRIGFNSGNSRNGAYTRTLHTEYGDLALSMPRDRNGEFNQQTVAPYKRSNDTLESFVIHMFQKGVTMSEISDLIEKMYGHHYTPQTITNMTKVMSEQVEAFKSRPLEQRYACVYLDATYIALKHDTVSKEAVYVTVGIREDGSKEVLAYTVAPMESAFVWKEVLLDLKERGVEEVLLFISDGLKGITDRIFAVFPDAQYQACCVHLSRGIHHKVRVSDRKEILDDFKSVYRAENRQLGEKALKTFVDKWKTVYPKVTKSLEANPYIFTFYSFPKSIWRSIYSTNLIESFNKNVKKYSKRKERFPNEDSFDRFLVSQFEIYNQNFSTRCHIGFDQARAALAEMFK